MRDRCLKYSENFSNEFKKILENRSRKEMREWKRTERTFWSLFKIKIK